MNKSLKILGILIFAQSLISNVYPQSGGICVNDEDCGINGDCVDNGTYFECQCNGRWDGIFCNESLLCNDAEACSMNGECSTTDTGFTCDCDPDFAGVTCSYGICPNITESYPFAENGDVFFVSVPAQDTSISNITCPSDVGFFANASLGTKKCGDNSTWEDTVWIVNCSADLSSLNSTEQTNAIQVATSDPSFMTDGNIDELLSTFNDLSTSATNAKEVSQLVSTVDNLLQAVDSVFTSVQNNASDLLNGLQVMAESVELTLASENLFQFESKESEIAVLAAEYENAADVVRATSTPLNYVISLTNILQPEDGLRGAQFDVGNSSDSASPLYASLQSNDRVTFQLFADQSLFPADSSIDPRVESHILGVNTNGTLADLQMKFYLFELYNNLNEMGLDMRSNRMFFCASWNEATGTWSKPGVDCSSVSVDTPSLYNFVTCNCTKTGYFSVLSSAELEATTSSDQTSAELSSSSSQQSLASSSDSTQTDGTTPQTNSGLSDGEIAGIVIGSIAGAILIFGGIGYLIYRNKKKKKVASSQVIMLQENDHFNSETRPRDVESSSQSSSDDEK